MISFAFVKTVDYDIATSVTVSNKSWTGLDLKQVCLKIKHRYDN